MKIFIMIGLILYFVIPAEAKWHYRKSDSAFSDSATSMAFTTNTRYGFGFNCTPSSYYTVVFITPDKSLDVYGEELVDVFRPVLLIKIDNDPIVRLPAETRMTPMGASFLARAHDDLVQAAKKARRHISLALELVDDVYHETRFSVRHSSKHISRIEDDCGVAEQPGSVPLLQDLPS